MMSFSELVKNRQSCRQFTGDPVSPETLTTILEAGRLAPSAINGQPWHFYVLVEAADRAQLAKGLQSFAAQAGAFIVIVEQRPHLAVAAANQIKHHQFPQMDIGIVAAHMVLQAQALGVAQCILGWFNEAHLRRVLKLPKKTRIRLVLALGKAQDQTVRPKKRKASEAVITYV